ncbi:hypothetical protein M5K25_002514 [Dendrobium thyrsiflorum]|uniref:Uncharacterized protein n=1 Tax=Dendrobium thyrsiflorum TaxID=117978 RepID=A0ABD0VMR9_DENTH
MVVLNLTLVLIFSSFPDLKPTTQYGMTALWVSEKEAVALATPFQFARVGKFIVRRLKLDFIRQFFFNLKLSGNISITLLDPCHTAFFSTRILYCLGSLFGRPLQVDNATTIGSRPSIARVLVELNIIKQYPNSISLGPEKNGYVQKVVMNDVQDFCDYCKTLGHIKNECYHFNPNLILLLILLNRWVLLMEMCFFMRILVGNRRIISFFRSGDNLEEGEINSANEDYSHNVVNQLWVISLVNVAKDDSF